MFDELLTSQNKQPSLQRMGRHLDTVCMLSTEKDDWLLTISNGRVTDIRSGPLVMPGYSFRIVADECDWLEFLQPVPKPGRHDIIALLRRGVLRFEGNLHPLMSHLMYFKRLLATLRDSDAAGSTGATL